MKNCYLQNTTKYLQGRVLSILSHSKQSWQVWVKCFSHITSAHFWHWDEYLFMFDFVSLCPWPCYSFMQSLQHFRLGIFGGTLFGKSLPSPLSTRFPTTRYILFCMLLLNPLTDLWFTYGTTRDFTNSHPKPTELIFLGFSLLFIDQTVELFISLVFNRYGPATAFWITRVKLGSLVDYICPPIREIIHFIDLRLLLTVILCDCSDRFQGRQKKNFTQSCRLCFYYVAVKCHSYITSIPKNFIWQLLSAGGFHKLFW